MDAWKKRETDRCMDASLAKQNEEHKMDGTKKINKAK
jgi:hypothetical protein